MKFKELNKNQASVMRCLIIHSAITAYDDYISYISDKSISEFTRIRLFEVKKAIEELEKLEYIKMGDDSIYFVRTVEVEEFWSKKYEHNNV